MSDRVDVATVERALVACALLICASASIAAAQVAPANAVRGRVQGIDGTPIAGAMVRLERRGDSLRTSEAGEFSFHGVPPGDEQLQIRAIGFLPKRVGLRVTADSGWTGTIAMDRVPQPLPDVQVVAKPPEFAHTTKSDDFFRRQRLGFGTFRSREDIAKMGALDVAAVLKSIPGVTVTGTANMYGEPEIHFRLARCPGEPPNMSIYVNGNRIFHHGNKGSELSGLTQGRRRRGGADVSTCEVCASLQNLLSSIPFADIQFVEFYRGPGQTPAEYDLGDSCAVLGIWTR